MIALECSQEATAPLVFFFLNYTPLSQAIFFHIYYKREKSVNKKRNMWVKVSEGKDIPRETPCTSNTI